MLDEHQCSVTNDDTHLRCSSPRVVSHGNCAVEPGHYGRKARCALALNTGESSQRTTRGPTGCAVKGVLTAYLDVVALSPQNCGFRYGSPAGSE